MCRHLAYLGPPASLHDLVAGPPHSLFEQSYAPRRQRHGTMNADGFGAGWYAPGRPEPVRFRRAQPIWTDRSFASLAPTVETRCLLAAVRCATVGYPVEESCTAPFTHGSRLFSHNGAVADPALMRKTLRDDVYAAPDAAAPVDSAFLFGLATTRWEGGASLGEGLAGTVTAVADAGGGRLTVLATDGSRVAGVVWGEPLYVRERAESVVVASEPDDDGSSWREVPDRSLVEADAGGVSIRPLTQEETR